MTVVRPVSAVAWELRGAWARTPRRPVVLSLSERCTPRRLEGRVEKVAATNAFAIVDGCHVPLEDVLAVHRPHHTQKATA